MAIKGKSAELEYARRRARTGLWIGPGFFVIASLAVSLFAVIWSPESRNFGRGLVLGVMALSSVLHLGCFYEFLIVVKFLGHRPLPLAVLLLVGYWVLLAVIVLVSVLVR